jgi:predicted RNA-binding Zn-ribbon protein involved in translation (DUF1610 family)
MYFKDGDLKVRTRKIEGGVEIKIKLTGSPVMDESKILFLARSARTMFLGSDDSVVAAGVVTAGGQEVRMPVTASPQAALGIPPESRTNAKICPVCHRKLSFHSSSCRKDRDRFNCSNCGYTEPVIDRK